MIFKYRGHVSSDCSEYFSSFPGRQGVLPQISPAYRGTEGNGTPQPEVQREKLRLQTLLTYTSCHERSKDGNGHREWQTQSISKTRIFFLFLPLSFLSLLPPFLSSLPPFFSPFLPRARDHWHHNSQPPGVCYGIWQRFLPAMLHTQAHF